MMRINKVQEFGDRVKNLVELGKIKQNIETLSKENSLAIDSIFIEQNGKIDCFFYQKEKNCRTTDFIRKEKETS